MNKVMLIGHLGKDAERRELQDNKSVTRLSVATTERWGSGDARQERTEWHSISAWNLSEKFTVLLTKGRLVCVEGSLRTREYEDKEGIKRRVTEINSDDVQLLDKAPSASNASSSGSYGKATAAKPATVTRATSSKRVDTTPDEPLPPDDDIPF